MKRLVFGDGQRQGAVLQLVPEAFAFQQCPEFLLQPVHLMMLAIEHRHKFAVRYEQKTLTKKWRFISMNERRFEGCVAPHIMLCGPGDNLGLERFKPSQDRQVAQ